MDKSAASDVNTFGKGTRGTSWTRQEIRCLMSVWGDAELKYCFSSMRRNIHIFTYMSAELRKVNVNRSAIEIRTKTKLLRRDFKRAVAQNSRSGGSPSDFIWMDEMQRIFRGDPSIQPHRATESEAPRAEGANVTNQHSIRQPTATPAHVEATAADCYRSSNDEIPFDIYTQDTNSQEEQHNASTSSLSSDRSCTDLAQMRNADGSTPEESMDPASRIAQMRRRKKRASAATKLDDTLNNYFDWIKSANKENQSLFRGAVQRLGNLMQSAITTFQEEASKSQHQVEETNGEVEQVKVSPVDSHQASHTVVRSSLTKKYQTEKPGIDSSKSTTQDLETGCLSIREPCCTRKITVLRERNKTNAECNFHIDPVCSSYDAVLGTYDIVPEVLVSDTCTDIESEKEEDVLNKSVSLLAKASLSKLSSNVKLKGREKPITSKCDLLSSKSCEVLTHLPASKKNLETSFGVPEKEYLTSTPLEPYSKTVLNMVCMKSCKDKDPYVVVKDENSLVHDLMPVTPVKRIRKPRVVFSPI